MNGPSRAGPISLGAKENETPVPGKAYAAPSMPMEIDKPPKEWLDDSNESDPDKPFTMGGPLSNILRQGPHPDSSRAHAKTDYIYWKVLAATLRAEGQVEDADPKDASFISSDAWGAQLVDAQVTRAEGDQGTIRAVNELSFSYSYLISGGAIAEASVQLEGEAKDIKGNHHQFELSEQTSEKVQTTVNRKEGFREADYQKTKISLAATTKGGSARLSSESGSESERYSHLSATVTRRLAKSTGDNDSTPTVQIEEEIAGKTPLRKHYEVFSQGSVTLRARTAASDGETGPVVIRLKKFRIQNTLRVWKSATRKPPSDPECPPPPPGSPTGGPTTQPPDPIPDTPPPGPTTQPGEDPTPSDSNSLPSGPAPRNVYEPQAVKTLLLPGMTPAGEPIEARCALFVPHGIAGEAGARPGELRIMLDSPAPRDLEFEVVTRPPGLIALDSDPGGRIKIPAGEQRGVAFLTVDSADPAAIDVRFLDAGGAPTAQEARFEFLPVSTSDIPAPELWARLGGHGGWPGLGFSVRVLQGEKTGSLEIGRLGYRDYATADTVVDVQVEDPQGVLDPLPARITIPAGEPSTAVDLRLRKTAGQATILLQEGDSRLAIHVRSVQQGWSTDDLVRIPAGAVGILPIRLVHAQAGVRVVSASWGEAGPGVAEFAGSGETKILPGERAWFLPLKGLAQGTAEVRLASAGLPDLVVPIEVVAARVSLAAGKLELTGIDPTAGGRIHLWVPEGVRIEGLRVPVALQSTLAVQGVGTAQVVLAFSPGPDLPQAIELPIAFVNETGETFDLGVLDARDDVRAGGRLANFFIEVR